MPVSFKKVADLSICDEGKSLPSVSHKNLPSISTSYIIDKINYGVAMPAEEVVDGASRHDTSWKTVNADAAERFMK